jgi:hypothetical protein
MPKIILLVLKSGLLDQTSITLLPVGRLNVKLNLLIKGWLATQNINFRALQCPNFDWEATVINKDKMFLRTAAFYHYDLDVTSLSSISADHGEQQVSTEAKKSSSTGLVTCSRASIHAALAGIHTWHS